MRRNRITALVLALLMLFAPLSDSLQTVAALAEVEEELSLDPTSAALTSLDSGETEDTKKTEAPEGSSAPKETEAPEGSSAPKETEAPEGSSAPKETEAPEDSSAPKETEAPEGSSAPKETQAPEGSSAPKETQTPKETEAPAETETPAPTELIMELPAEEEEYLEPFLMNVDGGIMFVLAGSTRETLQKTLGVTVEWVDDGVTHTNNLELKKFVDNKWVVVDGDATVSVSPNPNDEFSGKRQYIYTVNAGVRYMLTAPEVKNYTLETLDVTDTPTLSAAFRYVSQVEKTAKVRWVGDPAGTTHGAADAPVAVYRNGTRVADAQVAASTEGNVTTYTFTGLDPKKLDAGNYTITLTVPGGYEDMTTEADAKKKNFTLLNTEDTKTVSASVQWWDGHSVKRPDITPRLPKLQVKRGDDWVNIEAPLSKENKITNDDTEYVFYGLPKDEEYQVSFGEKAPKGYIFGEENGTTVLIKQADFTFHKQWRDYSLPDPADNYLTEEEYVKLLKLYVDSGEGEDQQSVALVYNQNVIVNSKPATGIDDWEVTITGLPGYSGVDQEITYYITEQNRTYNTDGDRYELTILNYGNHATESKGIYSGGRSISTLEGTTAFSFTKNWNDDGGDASERPDVTFYLYRFPINNGSFVDSAPVVGMDYMTVPKTTEDEITYTYTVDDVSSLPKYDENGALYVYYVLERMSSGSYVAVVDNTSAADFWNALGKMQAHEDTTVETPDGFKSTYVDALKRYVLDGGTIRNVRQESITVDYTKRWVSKATQGFQGSVTVQLERRVKGAVTWEPVPDNNGNPVTQTISGFKAEMMSCTSAFTDLPLYNEEGGEYEYRVRETAVTVNDTAAQWNDEGTYFTAGDYEFTVDHNDLTNTITNTLVGETEFQIKKRWQPAPENGEGSIVVQMYQNGVHYTPEESMLPADAEIVDGKLVLHAHNLQGSESDPSAWASWLLLHLPKYDPDGAKYTYTASEIKCYPEGYYLNDQRYTTEEREIVLENGAVVKHDVVTRTFVNVLPDDGHSMYFEAEKVWLDDNDLLHRHEVTVQLYYKRVNADQSISLEAIPDKTVKLNEDNQWTERLSYIPSVAYSPTSPEWNTANYVLREVSIKDDKAKGGQAAVVYLSEDAKNGKCTTTEHVYAVTNDYQASGLTASVVVTNLRTGTVNMEITKTWNVGGMTKLPSGSVKNSTEVGKDMVAKFTVYQDGKPYRDPYELPITDEDNKLTIWDLPKYDNQGVLYNYTLQESGLNDLVFEDGMISWSDFIISSSVKVEPYEVGENHTNDWMRARFTNTRSSSNTILVNKVWRDEGTSEVIQKRPDIVLSLYRQSVDENGEPLNQRVMVELDRLWDTRVNSWYWICSFGDQPLYDEQGYRYVYTVEERIIQASPARYEKSYYIPKGEKPEMPSKDHSPANTKAVFASMGGNFGHTLAGPEGHQGTVINTRAGTMSFTGRKIWESLPEWFQYKDLPDVTIQLYRSEKVGGKWTEPAPYFDASGEPVVVTLTSGNTTYSFDQLPRYDDYGCPVYKYTCYEVVRDEKGTYVKSAPVGYEVNYAANEESGEITNIYKGTPYIKISAQKEWDWTALEQNSSETTYPSVTLTLYQCYMNEEQGYNVRRRVGKVVLEGGNIPSNKELTTTKYTFTNLDDGSENFPYSLPFWGNEKYHYTYVVEETLTGTDKVLGGYDVDISSVKNDENDNKTLDFTVKNTYNGKKNELVAYKIWQDDNNAYGLRPAIGSEYLDFTFYRMVSGKSEVLSGKKEWSQDTNNTNRWICTFTPDEPLYDFDTNGRYCTYYVTETLNEPYAKVYAQFSDSNPYDLFITNALNRVNLSVKKDWSLGTTPIEKQQDVIKYIQPLLELLGIHEQLLTFQLTSTDTATLDAIQKGVRDGKIRDTVSLNVVALAADRYLQNGFLLFSNLPKYVWNGTEYVEASYVIKETLIGDQVVGRSGCDFTMTSDRSGDIFSFTNSIDAVKLSLTKIWDDAYNQDGLRPKEIQVTVRATMTDDKYNDTVLTMRYNPGDPSAPWTSDIYLPKRIGGETPSYTITEVKVDGYSVAYKLDGQTTEEAPAVLSTDVASTVSSVTLIPNKNYELTMTNKHDPERFNAVVLKDWEGDEKFVDIVRPGEANVTLQYNTDNGDKWKVYKDENFASKTLNKGNNWRYTWENLFVYKPKTESDVYDPATLLYYSVKETDADDNKWPYEPSYAYSLTAPSETPGPSDGATGPKETGDTGGNEDSVGSGGTGGNSDSARNGSTAASEMTHSFNGLNGNTYVEKVWAKVTNTMKTVSVTGKKVWEDTDFANIARPDSITLWLEYRVGSEDWTKLDEFTLVKDSTITNQSTVTEQSHTWSNLPKYNKENKEIKYQVREIDALKGYAEPNYDTAHLVATNTLKTLEISVTKKWKGDSGSAEGTDDGGSSENTEESGSAENTEGGGSTEGSEDSEDYYFTRDKLVFYLKYRAKGSTEWSELSKDDGSRYEIELSTTNGWTGSFSGLPAYNSAGTLLQYMVEEVTPPNYEKIKTEPSENQFSYDASKADQYNVYRCSIEFTNKLYTTELPVRKAWEDEFDGVDNKYGLRIDKIDLILQRTTTPNDERSWVNVPHRDGKGSADTYKTITLESDGSGTYTFSYLPAKDKSGNDYSYRAIDVVNGYSCSYDPDTDVLTNTLETTSITVRKSWVNGDGWDTKFGFEYPQSISYKLYYKAFASNETPDTDYKKWTPVPGGEGLTLTENNWTATINDLPKYDKDGNTYYYVAVDEETGYNLTVTPVKSTDTDTTVTMANAAKTTKLVVTKTWDDDNNTGMRPDGLSLTLQYSTDGGANWVPVSGVTPTYTKDGNTWTITYSNLPAWTWQNGAYVPYKYRVVEDETKVPHYKKAEGAPTGENDADGYSQTLTNKLDAMEISVTKAWTVDGKETYLDKTKGNVTVQLQRKLTSADDNAWAPWEISTKADGKDQSSKLTLTKDNNWTASWKNILKTDASGNAYEFRVVETSGPVNFPLAAPATVTVGSDGKGSATVANVLATTSLSFTKQWDDNNNALRLRPEKFEITVQSRVGEEEWADFDKLIFWPDQTGSLTMTVSGLPKYRYLNGVATAIQYHAIDSVTGYVYSWDEDHKILTNQVKSYTIEVTKDWEDQKNAYLTQVGEITLQLRRREQNGTWESIGAAKTISEATGWKATFTDLPAVYWKDGEELAYEYGFVESGCPGYEATINGVPLENYAFECKKSGSAAEYANTHKLTLVNTLKVTSLTGRKVWHDQDNKDSNRPDTLTVTLQRSINPDDENAVWTDVEKDRGAVTAELNVGNNWTYTFTGLPAKDASGKDYTYRIHEYNVPSGYTLGWEGVRQDGAYVLINRLMLPGFTGQKVWDDQNNRFGVRPKELTVTLQRSINPDDENAVWEDVLIDDEPVQAVLNDDNAWSESWFNLPAVDADGKAYTYRIHETVPTGYILSGEEIDECGAYVLTNALETTSVAVSKSWSYDADWMEAYGFTLPESISYELRYRAFAEDETVDTDYNEWDPVPGANALTLKPNDKGDWADTVEELPKYDASGNPYYYVALDSVTGFVLTASSDSSVGLALIMRNTAEKTKLVVTKVWEDFDDRYELRPDGLSLTLQYSFDGVNWTDVTDAEFVRDEWTYTYSNLPAWTWKNGAYVDYKYRVVEGDISHYTLTGDNITGKNNADGYSQRLTNTLDALDISVTKEWTAKNDNTYLDKTKGNVTVQLQRKLTSADDSAWAPWTIRTKADGKDQSSKLTLTKDNNWTASWKNILKTDASGNAYEFRVVETSAPVNYQLADPATVTVSSDGKTGSATVANVLATTSLSFTKQWNDNGNALGLREKAFDITVQSKVDGEDWIDFDTRAFEPDQTDGLTMTISGLPTNRWVNGEYKEIEYRAIDNVKGYVYTWDDQNKTLTNQVKSYTIEIAKDWEDQENAYLTQVGEITLQLRQYGADEKWVDFGTPQTISAASGWKATFTNLPAVYWKDGKEKAHKYSLVENGCPAYAASIGGVPLENYVFECKTNDSATEYAKTHKLTLVNSLKETSFTGRKVWYDQNNKDGNRPDALTVTLQYWDEKTQKWEDVKKKGIAVTAELSSDEDWTYTFTELPAKDASGKDYTYRIHEYNVPDGYMPGKEGVDDDGVYELTNRLMLPGFTGQKVWDDQNNRFGVRPKELTVTLQRSINPDDENAVWEDVEKKVLDDSNGWSYNWPDLPAVDADGKAYTYRIHEGTVPTGYILSGEEVDECGAYVLTNALETTSVAVSKSWSYGADWMEAYGFTLPESIGYELRYRAFAEGEEVDADYESWTVVPGASELTLAPNDEGEWTAEITGLPKYDASGKRFVYVALDSVTGFALTASHGSTATGMVNTAEATRLVVTKRWNDANNIFKLRPDELSLTLLRSTDGENWTEVSGAVPVREGWTYTYGNLPAWTWEGDTALAYQYRAEEAEVPQYKLTEDSVTGENDAEGYSQTLENSLQTTDITVTKEWKAEEEHYLAKTIGSVTVQLQRKLIGEGEDAWTACAPATGEDQSSERILSDESDWIGTWSGMPKQNADGNAYVYRVVEIAAPVNYPLAAPVEVSIDGSATIVNTLETIDLSVTKQWNDDNDALDWRPDTFNITLQYRVDGEDWADFDTRAFEPDLSGTQTMTITGLPKYSWKDGVAREIEYRAIDSVTGYVYSWNPETGTLTNQVKSYTIRLEKEWEDQDNAYGTRDGEITLQLRQRRPGGAWIDFGAPQTVSAASNPAWTAVFTNLPAVYVDADGLEQPYEYSLVEISSLAYDQSVRLGSGRIVPLEDYVFTCQTDGDPAHYTTTLELTLINSLKEDGFTVRKIWDDRDDLYGFRPESLTVTLQRWVFETETWEDVLLNGSVVTAVLNAENHWTYTFRNLPTEDASGRTCFYRITEEDVPRYTMTGASLGEGGVYTLTNHLNRIYLNVTKVWDDQQDLYHNRPDSLDVALECSSDGGLTWQSVEQDGVPVTAQLTAPDWKYSFDDLPDQDADGASLIYRVVETVPDGYTASEPVVNGPDCSLVNTLQTVTISGEKHWEDEDNRYNTRPERIELLVYRNGERMDPQPEVAFDGWSFTIIGLPRYVDGELAVYSVEELPVAFYAAQESIVTAVPDEEGCLKLVLNNGLLRMLMIDNLTPNAAHPGVTNVGGFVGVGLTAEERDEHPYVVNATTVTWRHEEDWLHDCWMNVKYLEFGADEWITLHLSDCFDLTELKERFPNARITEEGDTRRLILADSAEGMPMLTRVEVAFLPTIAVENTTSGDRGGQVRVETGVYSNVGDGLEQRYVQKTVYGLADSGWMVDLDHLAIGIPGSQRGAYSENSTAVPLKLREDGSFSAAVAMELAGCMETVTVTGQVKVLKRDENGNPIQISLTVDSLPGNLDVGIPFETAKVPSTIPQTGDMLAVALTVGGVCLAALILLGVSRRKRRR